MEIAKIPSQAGFFWGASLVRSHASRNMRPAKRATRSRSSRARARVWSSACRASLAVGSFASSGRSFSRRNGPRCASGSAAMLVRAQRQEGREEPSVRDPGGPKVRDPRQELGEPLQVDDEPLRVTELARDAGRGSTHPASRGPARGPRRGLARLRASSCA